jgi:alpha-mannosidase
MKTHAAERPATIYVLRQVLAAVMLLAPCAVFAQAEQITTHLSNLDLSALRQDWGKPHRDQSVGDVPLKVGSVQYPKGVGTHAASSWRLTLDGKGVEFRAKAGIQDGARAAEFIVWGDTKILYRSGPMRGGEAAREIRVPLAGVLDIELGVVLVDGKDAAHADWLDPVIVHNGAPLTPSTRQWVRKNPNWPQLEEVIICWKSHCDIGYTHPVPEVLQNWRVRNMEAVLKLFDDTKSQPPDERFKWMTPAWPMELVLDQQQDPARRARIEQAVRDGRMLWHALPYTLEAEAADIEELVRGLGCGSRVARQFGMKLPEDAKITDMPSEAWGLPVVLSHAGVKFLHIGVNPWSPNPKVPLLFWWEGPDGSRLLTGYGFHNYSWPPLPPAGWPHKTWLMFHVNGDNSPPPSLNDISNTIGYLYRTLPGVRVRFGRPSDFADAIISEHASNIPVVRGNMPDTWTHGQMSMPMATKMHRQETTALISLGELDTQLRAWGVKTDDVAPVLAKAYERSALFTEHTWGIYGPAFGTPTHEQWEKDLAAGKYEKQLATFAYKAQYARKAAAMAGEGLASRMNALAQHVNIGGRRVVVYNPLPWSRSGTFELDGKMSYAENVPAGGYKTIPAEAGIAKPLTGDTLETTYFRINFDTQRGGIRSLVEKKTGRELADTGEHALGQFVHERFSKANVDAFLKAYCHVYYDWFGFPFYDFNKPKLDPALTYHVTSPRDWTLRLEREAAGDYATLTTTNTDGLAASYTLAFFFPATQPSVDITWKVNKKKPELIPEGGWICLPLAVNTPAYRVSQTGAPFRPERDLIEGANHRLFSIDSGISVREGAAGAGIGVASADLPLWSIGEPGLWKYDNYLPTNAALYANLYNNQWNTNYPLWVSGSWSATIRLWPIAAGATEEAALFTPAWELRQPLLAAAADGPAGKLPATQSGVTLSRKGVRVTAFCPNPDGRGTVLRVWEQAGVSGAVTVTIPGNFKTATPVNLRGETIGEPSHIKTGKLTFHLSMYAPASYLLGE